MLDFKSSQLQESIPLFHLIKPNNITQQVFLSPYESQNKLLNPPVSLEQTKFSELLLRMQRQFYSPPLVNKKLTFKLYK